MAMKVLKSKALLKLAYTSDRISGGTDWICRKYQQAFDLTDTLLRATFLNMFSDPVTNPKGWEEKAISEIIDIPLRNGVSPSSSGKFAGNVLTLTAITKEQFDQSESKLEMLEKAFYSSGLLDSRDFLICRGNGNKDLVGKGYFATVDRDDTIFPDTMIAARPNKLMILRAYLEAAWSTVYVRDQILRSANTTNGTYKINQTAVKNIKIFVPPIRKQRIFQDFADVLANKKQQSEKALNKAELAFLSLPQRAFKGEL